MSKIALSYKPLSEIRVWDKNPKLHDLEGLMASFRRYGFVNPLIVNEATGILLVGHGRYLALERMKGEGEPPPQRITVEDGEWLIPVVTDVWLGELEAMSYAVDDNLSTMAGGDLTFLELSRAFNEQRLAEVLEGLATRSEMPVFAKEEEYQALLEALLEAQSEPIQEDFDIEEALEAYLEPRIGRGEVWQLGRHRLMCGDSTNPDDVAALMAGELAKLVVTDPPYGVGLGLHRGGGSRSRTRHRPIENDDLTGQALLAFLSAAFSVVAQHTAEDASWYVWHASSTRPIFLQALQVAGVDAHQEIVWVKESFQLGYADYHWQHESCLYGWRERHRFYGGRNQSTVWQVVREREGQHPATKPVELFARPMGNNLKPGELALDMFLGSGTAIIAAEKLLRRCYGMEIDPVYCEVAIQRWERYSGKKAEQADE